MSSTIPPASAVSHQSPIRGRSDLLLLIDFVRRLGGRCRPIDKRAARRDETASRMPMSLVHTPRVHEAIPNSPSGNDHVSAYGGCARTISHWILWFALADQVRIASVIGRKRSLALIVI